MPKRAAILNRPVDAVPASEGALEPTRGAGGTFAGKRVAARSGELTNRCHRGSRQRITTGLRLNPADDGAPNAGAQHAEAERSDDQDRGSYACPELAADEVRVPLGPLEHRRLVGQVALAGEERDLDRVAAPLRRLQEPEQLELDRLGWAVGERGVERFGLEVVGHRVAVPHRAGRGGERKEHGDGGGGLYWASSASLSSDA